MGKFQGKQADEGWNKVKWNEELSKENGLESLREMQDRAGRMIEELKSEFQGKTIILVGHHAMNLAIVNYIQGKSPLEIGRYPPLKNTCISIFETDLEGNLIMKLHNCTRHLN